MKRTVALVCVLAVSVVGLTALVAARSPDRVAALLHPVRTTEPTVLFVVVDTVRADHTSLCGYDRPTTPILAERAAQGVASCNAVAPGSWTLPSHASFFTGLEVPDHGAHFAATSTDAIRGMHLTPLPENVTTLADAMAERGYQTVGVSGNPVLTEASGVVRGFADWTVAEWFSDLYGSALVAEVRNSLDRADTSQPLFLFVNIADAHDPWFGVPEGLDWVEPQTETLHYFADDEPGEWEAFVSGDMPADEQAELTARVTDLYDVAVARADNTLGELLSVLETRGWFDPGVRVVVVSDHGEFLGEHQLLRHGRYLWEPNNRVPVVAWSTTPDAPVPSELPEGLNAQGVYDLVLHGEIRTIVPARAAAYPDRFWIERSGGLLGNETSAAWWQGTDKWVWTDGDLVRYDLAQDPGELRPLPADALPDGFDAWVTAVQQSGVRSGEMDPDLRAALEAAGYLAPQ